MMPYGILFKGSKQASINSLILWQKNFGMLKISNFLKISLLPAVVFTALYIGVSLLTDEKIKGSSLWITAIMQTAFVLVLMYLEIMKTVKMYASGKNNKMQIVLKEELMEIKTTFSKDEIPYNEIDLCIEKDFLLTIIYDKNTIPYSVAKTEIEKGSYDVFNSILKEKLGERFIKKGEY